MKSIPHNLTKSLLLAVLLFALSGTPSRAQDEFPDDVNDEPPVPIDGLLISGFVAGSLIGLRKLKKAEN